ncbi:hypothetical protein TRFO_17335 [Tritrichomonas foetus]|uniref:Uncharacterized protein n=1 Tax=Tritrichomonas foetus TaxID=1144522 RepID=A0A1J4KN31_9EUKA|nr:hypothetical protein TRFO_17335 [Tritrichomonas foetus]|eukprot:OHT12721.1 hypothetical protein TRFO_17335 [Tritrichomonas foetus]
MELKEPSQNDFIIEKERDQLNLDSTNDFQLPSEFILFAQQLIITSSLDIYNTVFSFSMPISNTQHIHKYSENTITHQNQAPINNDQKINIFMNYKLPESFSEYENEIISNELQSISYCHIHSFSLSHSFMNINETKDIKSQQENDLPNLSMNNVLSKVDLSFINNMTTYLDEQIRSSLIHISGMMININVNNSNHQLGETNQRQSKIKQTNLKISPEITKTNNVSSNKRHYASEFTLSKSSIESLEAAIDSNLNSISCSHQPLISLNYFTTGSIKAKTHNEKLLNTPKEKHSDVSSNYFLPVLSTFLDDTITNALSISLTNPSFFITFPINNTSSETPIHTQFENSIEDKTLTKNNKSNVIDFPLPNSFVDVLSQNIYSSILNISNSLYSSLDFPFLETQALNFNNRKETTVTKEQQFHESRNSIQNAIEYDLSPQIINMMSDHLSSSIISCTNTIYKVINDSPIGVSFLSQ